MLREEADRGSRMREQVVREQADRSGGGAAEAGEFDPYNPANSCFHTFRDLERFAQAIPGGRFGVVPAANGAFEASVRVSSLTDGVAVRGVSLSHPVALRSEFMGGAKPSITFLFPVLNEKNILFDGRDFLEGRVVSRVPGQTPLVRTNGPAEIGGVVVRHEAFRRAASMLYGREHPEVFLNPASFMAPDPKRFRALVQVYLSATRMLQAHSVDALCSVESASALRLLREHVVTTLLGVLVEGEAKRDHLAHQRQTACMARMERLIDEHREDPIGLHGLCEGAGLALRTVEAIIRNRTGMTALQYLQRRYLAFARESLLKPEPGMTVTKVAMHNGFLHLGRFAALYRSVYGETPSVTLARALG